MPVRRESLTELHNRGRLAVVMVGKQIFDGDRRSEGLSEGARSSVSRLVVCRKGADGGYTRAFLERCAR